MHEHSIKNSLETNISLKYFNVIQLPYDHVNSLRLFLLNKNVNSENMLRLGVIPYAPTLELMLLSMTYPITHISCVYLKCQ